MSPPPLSLCGRPATRTHVHSPRGRRPGVQQGRPLHWGLRGRLRARRPRALPDPNRGVLADCALPGALLCRPSPSPQAEAGPRGLPSCPHGILPVPARAGPGRGALLPVLRAQAGADLHLLLSCSLRPRWSPPAMDTEDEENMSKAPSPRPAPWVGRERPAGLAPRGGPPLSVLGPLHPLGCSTETATLATAVGLGDPAGDVGHLTWL